MSSDTSHTAALVLAAGKGTRMCSRRPKVLHHLVGDSMLHHVMRALNPIFGDKVWTVIGYEAELVRKAFAGQAMRFVEQSLQLGTGHALMAALHELQDAGIHRLLVVNGDTPLLRADLVEEFIKHADGMDLAFATLVLEEPGAFGRVVRSEEGRVTAIIEAKEYNPDQHGPESHEVNTGMYMLDLKAISPLVSRLSNFNASGEYYITDLVGLAVKEELSVEGINCGDAFGLLGINTPAELSAAEERLRAEMVERLMESGVEIHAPALVRIALGVVVEPGVELTGPCEIYGTSHISSGTRIESHCVINNTIIAAGSVIRSFSHLEDAFVGKECTVGPYARLRPGAVMERQSHVGNFVEMKKATLGTGAKANHLTYLGDAEIGPGSNIGAGTITCNYDGENKHRTVIGANAFIGSNTALVAPVNIGDNSVIGAGSTISKDVPESHLAVTREQQKNLPRRR